MAQITGVQPSLFATLSFTDPDTVVPSTIANLGTNGAASTWTNFNTTDLFGTTSASEVTAVPHVREFPSLGTPANIVNVPVYGSTTSTQIQGQADLPSFEFTLNYVPEDHRALQAAIGVTTNQLFRLRLTNGNNVPANGVQSTYTAVTNLAQHSDFYFLGYVASFEVTPSLSDAMQATMSLAVQSAIVGPLSSA